MATPGTRRTMADWEHELKRPGAKLTTEEAGLLVQLAILERVEILKLMGDSAFGLLKGRTQGRPVAVAEAAHEPEPVGVNGQEPAG